MLGKSKYRALSCKRSLKRNVTDSLRANRKSQRKNANVPPPKDQGEQTARQRLKDPQTVQNGHCSYHKSGKDM